MTYQGVKALLAAALDGEPGWSNEAGTNCFAHEAAGVHVMIYSRDLVLALRDVPGEPVTKALGCRTTYHPAQAVAAVLEVARAVVAVRTAAAARTFPPEE